MGTHCFNLIKVTNLHAFSMKVYTGLLISVLTVSLSWTTLSTLIWIRIYSPSCNTVLFFHYFHKWFLINTFPQTISCVRYSTIPCSARDGHVTCKCKLYLVLVTTVPEHTFQLCKILKCLGQSWMASRVLEDQAKKALRELRVDSQMSSLNIPGVWKLERW